MPEDLQSMVEQYRSGLEAEMALLHQLEGLSKRQHAASISGDLATLPALHDARDSVMANLVSVEHELKPLRLALLQEQTRLNGTPEFIQIMAFHRDAAELVTAIVTSDRESLQALKNAEQARRAAADTIEKGETTLAAYRRVIAPSLVNATLVNRRG